jgi:hypothetical protein
MRARVDDQLAVAAQYALATANRMFDQLGGGEIFPQTGGVEFLGNGKNG